MSDAANQQADLKPETVKEVRGAIHFLNRIFPLIFEDKDFFMRSMWHEQAFFGN